MNKRPLSSIPANDPLSEAELHDALLGVNVIAPDTVRALLRIPRKVTKDDIVAALVRRSNIGRYGRA